MKKIISLLLLLNFSIKAQDVKIGRQTWASKNLDVSTYRNGDAIPQVQDANAWANLKTGAWCYYENKEENGTTFGKLYNWYAVIDPRGLAPEGYSIPHSGDWNKLEEVNLEGSIQISMKSTTGWKNDGNGAAENGFAGLPGGFRSKDGKFSPPGGIILENKNITLETGSWWCQSFSDRKEYDLKQQRISEEDKLIGINPNKSAQNPTYIYTLNPYGDIFEKYGDNFDEHYGFSVRCIKKKKRINLDE